MAGRLNLVQDPLFSLVILNSFQDPFLFLSQFLFLIISIPIITLFSARVFHTPAPRPWGNASPWYPFLNARNSHRRQYLPRCSNSDVLIKKLYICRPFPSIRHCVPPSGRTGGRTGKETSLSLKY